MKSPWAWEGDDRINAAELEPGQVEVATRETPDDTWGPPIDCTEERTFTYEPGRWKDTSHE